jgi:hypothetical protein
MHAKPNPLWRMLGVRACAASLLWLAIAGCGGGGGGSGPDFDMFTSVAVVDLDGDGLPDIAATFTHISGPPPHPGYVAVYLQLRGHPGMFAAPAIYAVGNDPFSIAVGDLDGDGRPDIVTANAILATSGAGVSDVSMLRQNPAMPGRFLAAVSYAVGAGPQDVAIGDIDGDGRPDLVVADNEGLSLLLQNAAVPGTFRPHTRIDVGGGTSSVTVADLNGDGTADLLATNAVNVLVLYGIAGSAPTFAAPLQLAAGAQPSHAAAGDLDGDGRLDIAVANLGSPSDPASASVSVLLQDPVTRGSFRASVGYATALRSEGVAIADLDGDGRADLAVVNGGSLAGLCPPDCGSAGSGVSILLQQPALAGRFQPAQNYPTADDYAQWVAVADVDGDGRKDLVIAQGNGIFTRLQDPAHPGQFLAGRPVGR